MLLFVNSFSAYATAATLVNLSDLLTTLQIAASLSSEVGEANYCGLPGTKQDVVDESNYGFCEIFAKFANKNTKILYENVINEYGLIADKNPVALYNYNRLYMS